MNAFWSSRPPLAKTKAEYSNLSKSAWIINFWMWYLNDFVISNYFCQNNYLLFILILIIIICSLLFSFFRVQSVGAWGLVFCNMLPAVFTTAMPERGSVIRNCKAAGSRSSRPCKPKSDLETFYCKICLCEYSAKKGQMLETCACKFCKEVCAVKTLNNWLTGLDLGIQGGK